MRTCADQPLRTSTQKAEKSLLEASEEHLCPECGKSYKYMRSLTDHRRKEHGQEEEPGERYLCPECGKSYKYMRSLTEHRRKEHGKGEGPRYSCDLCPQKFMKSRELQSHMNKHSSLKPFTCEKCNKAFANKRNTKPERHSCIPVSSSKQLHLCPVCNKQFKSTRNLREHAFLHTDTYRYSCNKCFKHFRYRSSLQHHMKKNCAG